MTYARGKSKSEHPIYYRTLTREDSRLSQIVCNFASKLNDMIKMIKTTKTVWSGLVMMMLTMLTAGCNQSTTAMDIEQQVDELYGKMTPEERIAQLKSMYMDELFDEQGKLDTAKCKELIPYGVGHFSQFCLQQPREPNELRDRVAAVQDCEK